MKYKMTDKDIKNIGKAENLLQKWLRKISRKLNLEHMNTYK